MMTPAERLASWGLFRRDATFDAQDFIDYIEHGRDEADRELQESGTQVIQITL